MHPTRSLPLVHITTDSLAPILDRETYIPATLRVEEPSDSTIFTDYRILIRGRGNVSWTDFQRKPYKVKLDNKLPFLGLPKNRHFALMNTCDSYLGLYNKCMGMELARMLQFDWTPSYRPLELILNGEFLGIYFVFETPRIDKQRLNIYEQPPLNSDPLTVPYGWLVELDNYRDPNQIIVPDGSQEAWITYHSPDELSPEQAQWLRYEFTELFRTINDPSTVENWVNFIDPSSFARYVIVRELLKDIDGFNGSLYMHRPMKSDAKWILGPMWDPYFSTTADSEQWIEDQWRQYDWSRGYLLPKIFHTENFRLALAQEWKKITGQALQNVFDHLLALEEQCRPAMDNDRLLWGYTFYEEVPQMCAIIFERANWLDGEISRYTTALDENSLSHHATPYTNLRGETFQTPTSPGIYIHNGRKVLIK